MANNSVWNNQRPSVFGQIEYEPKNTHRENYYWDAVDIRRSHALRHQTQELRRIPAMIAPSENGLRMCMRLNDEAPMVHTTLLSGSTMEVRMYENVNCASPLCDSAVLSWGYQNKRAFRVSWKPTDRMENLLARVDPTCAAFLRDGTKLLILSLLMSTFSRDTSKWVKDAAGVTETANGARIATIPSVPLEEWETLALVSAKKIPWKFAPAPNGAYSQ